MNRYYSAAKYESRNQFLTLGIKCVFISHQKADNTDARKVADYLEQAGIDVYFDEYDGDLRIQHEKDNPKAVTNAILNGINNSSHMLAIISPNTISSYWVPFEIGYGYDKTQLSVLCLKDIPKGKLPEFVRVVPIIRDIFDINNLIQRLSGKNKEALLESRMISDHVSPVNPLSSVMDSIIYDQY